LVTSPGEASVKFGVFYELSVPRPWTRESERTVYMNALEQGRKRTLRKPANFGR
jgi:hypothetical protein